jgi:hypothetical protein
MVWTKNEKWVGFGGAVFSLVATVTFFWLVLKNWTPNTWYFWSVAVLLAGLTFMLWSKLAYTMKWVK